MYTKEEKLSLLSEMIEFAQADHKIKEEEYDFILNVASQLNITKKEVDGLKEQKTTRKYSTSEAQRILQFHRLVLLMNIDQETSAVEIKKIKEFGVRMGLRSEAIDNVLSEMNNYPNKVVPPNKLIEIFSKFYN